MSEPPVHDVQHTRTATWVSVSTPQQSVSSLQSWEMPPAPMVGASVDQVQLPVLDLGPSHIPPQQQQQPQLPLLHQEQQQQQQQQQQQLQQQHGLADQGHGMTSLSTGGIVQPVKCEWSSSNTQWMTFKFLLQAAGFPTNAPELVHQQCRKTNQQRAQALSSIYVEHQAHIDPEWLGKQKTKCHFNWNHQIGGLVLFIDSCKDELQGYDSRMLADLAACIHLVMARCDVLVKGDCMQEFLKTLPPGTKLDWNIHKRQFLDFKKDCGGMKDMNYGAFGAWQPCFDMGLTFVVQIKVPTFAAYKHGDKDKAMLEIHQACIGHSKESAWWAKVDIHCSDNDGQRREDVWNHMMGINVMLKYMVNAYDHMMVMFDIAGGMEKENPNTGKLIQWQVRLCQDTRMTPLKAPKAEETPKIYSNGVLLQVPSASAVLQREEPMPSQAGVCPHTSLQTCQAVRDRVSGTTQALAVQKDHFVFQHNYETFAHSVSCFMEMDPFGKAFLNTPIFKIGQYLFTKDLEKATKGLLAILSQASKQDCMPPGFSLRQAKDTFAMWAHITDGDFDHSDPTTQLQVRQALMHAAFKKDDLMVTSDHPISVAMYPYDKESTSSQFDCLQDGDDVTYQIQDGSSVRTVGGLKIGFCLVFCF